MDTSQSKTFRLTIVRRKDGAECLRTGHPGTKGHAWCNLDLRVCTRHGAAGRGREGEQGVMGLPTSVRMISSDFGSASNRSEREQRGQIERPPSAHQVCQRVHGCSACARVLGVHTDARRIRLICNSKGCRLAFLFWRKRPILEELGSSCLVLPTEGRFLCLQPVEEEAAENDRSFFNSGLLKPGGSHTDSRPQLELGVYWL